MSSVTSSMYRYLVRAEGSPAQQSLQNLQPLQSDCCSVGCVCLEQLPATESGRLPENPLAAAAVQEKITSASGPQLLLLATHMTAFDPIQYAP
jgi:hypothetical protein